MTKKADKKLTLESHMNGRGLLFESGGRKFVLRPPTPAERDSAERESIIERRMVRMTDERIVKLASMSPPTEELEFYKQLLDFEVKMLQAAEGDRDADELERKINAMYKNIDARTSADSILTPIGRKARDRYLAKTLLCDEDGNPIDFMSITIGQQDEATDKASELWDSMEGMGFLSET